MKDTIIINKACIVSTMKQRHQTYEQIVTKLGAADAMSWFDQFEPDPSVMEAVWNRHRSEPDVTMVQYSRQRRKALGSRVAKMIRIYLDQNYWIYCRDAYLGRPQRPIHAAIYECLSEIVRSGRVVCPVSYPILVETLKQSDKVTRLATAHVIDQLSCDISLQPFALLEKIEFARFMALHTGEQASELLPLDQLVWTFPSLVAGEVHTSSTVLEEEADLIFQKACFDLRAELPFSSLIETVLQETPPSHGDSQERVAWMNEQTVLYEHELTSFDRALEIEVEGMLDVATETVEEYLRYEYEKNTKMAAPSVDSPTLKRNVKRIQLMLREVLVQNKAVKELPAIYIGAAIHAKIRFRKQGHRIGDLHDHLHASGALPYCSMFLTERALGSICCCKPLQLDKMFDCRVLWNAKEILERLTDLHDTLAKEGGS